MATSAKNSLAGKLRRLILPGFAALTVIPAHAQTYTESVLYSFCSEGGTNCTDGAGPGTLLQGATGDFYGTAYSGGEHAEGTIFKISASGSFTTLYSFCSQGGSNCTDGETPGSSALIQDAAGNFYGTTISGGANGRGTIFKLSPLGSLTTLYSFCSLGGPDCTDGYDPQAALVLGTDGNFYGTTQYGGANYNYGTIFKLTPAGKLITLWSFCSESNCADGQNPIAALIEANGLLYGTTPNGGYSSIYGSTYGTAFSITTSGALNVLYTFCEVANCSTQGELVGTNPESGFVEVGGNFYGTASANGEGGEGTVYEMTPSSGTITTLYSFCTLGPCGDGAVPVALILGSDGKFYGTTDEGGTYGMGTAFNITPSGTLTTLYSFCNAGGSACTDGENPYAGLIQGIDGNFYGASSGGANGHGTVYKITVNTTKVNSTTALTATPNPAGVGQAITLQTAVSGTNGTPTGTINFTVGTTSIGSATLNSSGIASLSASSNGIPPGTYPLVATYSGNAYYKASASSAYNVLLDKAVTSTTLTASPNPVTPPASVTLTATVTRSASDSTGEPTGTVTFYYQTTTLGTATLSGSGQASFNTSSKGIPEGKYAITAKYNGDASDAVSTSPALDVTVN